VALGTASPAQRALRHVGGGFEADTSSGRDADRPEYRAHMQKWEYATVPLLVHATKQILDNWGEDGWELVTLVPGPNSEQLVAYMKRPKESS
jgi:hypothetical protein